MSNRSSRSISPHRFDSPNNNKPFSKPQANFTASYLNPSFSKAKTNATPNLLSHMNNGEKSAFFIPHGNQQGHSQVSLPRKNPKIKVHPDDFIFSGAWLFDLSQAPAWFVKELNTVKNIRKQTSMIKKNKSKCEPLAAIRSSTSKNGPIQALRVRCNTDDDFIFESGSWLFDFSSAPKFFQTEINRNRSLNKSKKKSEKTKYLSPSASSTMEDILFESGLWLFDLNQAPSWFQKEVKGTSHNIARVYKQLPSTKAKLNVETKKIEEDEEEEYQFGSWLLDPSHSPEWFRQHLGLPSPTEVEVMAPSDVVLKQNQKSTTPVISSAKKPTSQKPATLGPLKIAHAHPDDAFYSGTWLFDASSCPTWLQQAFTTPRVSSANSPKAQSAVKSHSPIYNQHLKTHEGIPLPPIPYNIIKPQSDDLCLESGNWLFHMSEAPKWFQNEFLRPTYNKATSSHPARQRHEPSAHPNHGLSNNDKFFYPKMVPTLSLEQKSLKKGVAASPHSASRPEHKFSKRHSPKHTP